MQQNSSLPDAQTERGQAGWLGRRLPGPEVQVQDGPIRDGVAAIYRSRGCHLADTPFCIPIESAGRPHPGSRGCRPSAGGVL